jgi:hypothetical protein
MFTFIGIMLLLFAIASRTLVVDIESIYKP